MSLNDKFSGLPMDALIGGPLNVAAEAQAKEDTTLKAPLLKITPIPAFIMEELPISFDMEVKENQPPED